MKSKTQFKQLLLLLFVFTFSATVTFSQSCGDINADESTDIVDALLVAQCYVGLTNCPSAAIGDVNCDGSIDIIDGLLIAQLYVGLISTLHCCDPNPTPVPTMPDLAQWLNAHTRIAASIKWQYTWISTGSYHVSEDAKKAWPEWTPEEKLSLSTAFEEAWNWFYNQADPVNNLNETLVYPPVNIHENVDTDTSNAYTSVSKEYAWELYVRWIALNLMVEIGNILPWSILDYDEVELQVLFDSSAIMRYRPLDDYTICTAVPGHANFIYREDNLGSSLIAPPRYTYAFLAKNNIIGSNRYETIANLLQWVSENLVHFYWSLTNSNAEDHWQYRGIPPITRIIEGTTIISLNSSGHWTAGCHGTAGFLRNVLRAVNIPVHIIRVCGHSQAHFLTENLYLDHGDNPYNGTFKDSGLPASDLLIDETTYTSWFGTYTENHNNNCTYIGNQVNVLATAP